MSDTSEEYEIEKIVGFRKKKGIKYFKIKWLGYSEEENSWVSEKDISSTDLTRKYEQQLEQIKSKKPSKKDSQNSSKPQTENLSTNKSVSEPKKSSAKPTKTEKPKSMRTSVQLKDSSPKNLSTSSATTAKKSTQSSQSKNKKPTESLKSDKAVDKSKDVARSLRSSRSTENVVQTTKSSNLSNSKKNTSTNNSKKNKSTNDTATKPAEENLADIEEIQNKQITIKRSNKRMKSVTPSNSSKSKKLPDDGLVILDNTIAVKSMLNNELTPERVVRFRNHNDGVQYLLKFSNVDEAAFMSSEFMRNNCPQILIDYLMTLVHFVD